VTASNRTGTPPTVAGVLIIRVWFEPEHPVTLRARITKSMSANPSVGSELHGSTARTITVTRTQDLLDTVRAWLESLMDPTPAVQEHRQGH
jgi:hypothetical protein